MEPWRALLHQKERQGLRTLISIRLALFGMFFVMNLQVEQQSFSKVFLAGCLLVIASINVGLLFLLRANRWLSVCGIVGALSDAGILVLTQVVWYITTGGPDHLSPAFLSKTGMPIIATLMFALNSIMLRWQYVVIVVAGFSVYWCAQLFYLLSFPDIPISSSFVEVHLHGAVYPLNYLQNLIIVSLSGLVMALIARRARRITIEAARLERSNAVISRYFSPGVADHLASTDDTVLKPGGRKQSLAVLFSDIRGFTAISEQLPAEEVAELLSDYHSRMLRAIFAHGGTLDKFIGDGIMADFGAPTPDPQAATNAVLAGATMKAALEELNHIRIASGKAAIQTGIGVHYGESFVGNIGTQERLEYTVIGDVVNTASRLEACCKVLGHGFLISRNVFENLNHARLEERGLVLDALGSVSLRGKQEAIEVWSVRVPLVNESRAP